ncbi:MAG: M28 family peptidase [Candidatus Bathyarchaeota archaeon]|nr:MAG: M28 family peptidase [Candidatus Bathyarchaeota archaeon]
MSGRLSEVERRILGEVHSSSEAMSNLTALCDDFGGRFAGTPENREAAEFLLGRFEEYGFEAPHLETFRFMGCDTGQSSLEILEPVRRKIPCLTLPMTASGQTEAELVCVDDRATVEEEFTRKVVMGRTRLPFIRSSETDVSAYVWVHPYPAMGPPTGCIRSTVPAVSVKYEDGEMLGRLLRRHGRVRVRVEAECETFERESWNVCGEIPGNGNSEEFVLFGGHYDGHEIAQAAFDCGAPCAAVTEMGRILNTEREHLDRGLRVVLFSAEEFGFWGSRDYVKRHTDELEDLRFAYQLDCCGGGSTQMVTVDFWPELEPFYRRLAMDMNMEIPFEQRRGPGDSRPFFEIGIPTGSIIDYRKPGMLELLKTYRHTVYDTLDKIDPRSLRDAVAIGAVSGYRMMNAESWPSHRGPEEVERYRDEPL